jgi:hypothetical protein
MIAGRSARAVFHSVSFVTPKYSWTTMFRIARISAQGISGCAAMTSFGTCVRDRLADDAKAARDGVERAFVRHERGEIHLRDVALGTRRCFYPPLIQTGTDLEVRSSLITPCEVARDSKLPVSSPLAVL